MRGELKYDVNQIKDCYDYLLSLNIDSDDNALWDYFHRIIWHVGIDRVNWILRNKDLINELIQYSGSSRFSIPDELKKRLWVSIDEIKNIGK